MKKNDFKQRLEESHQISDEHPRITKGSVYATFAFASEALRADVVYPIQQERKAGAKASEVHG